METPTNIGRYEVERLLGHGGMAVVYLATDPYMERSVAIKLLPHQFTFSDKLRQRFFHEARVIAALEHPAIVPTYDFGEHEGQPYLVMRYMPGGSLRDRLTQPLSLEAATEILTRLAPALDKAHAQGIIHRDLKPDNVLFDGAGWPYLADFGVARLTEATQTMSIAGTPLYMSPEQAQGDQALDARTDIYALGVMLFEMLAGESPYQANTPLRLLFKHVNDPVPDIRTYRPDLPPSTQNVLERAMAKSPDDRYPSATAMAEALRSLSSSAPAPGAKTILEPFPATPGPGQGTVAEGGQPAQPATSQQAEAQSQSPSPAHRIPVWGWAAAGLLLLALLAWGAGGLFGSADEATPTVPVIVDRPTNTSTPQVSDTPTHSPTPTSTATPQPTPSVTSSPTATTTPDPDLPPPEATQGDTWMRPADDKVMVYVPAGTFRMGSDPADPNAGDDELPPHEVALDAFWIDRTEVTNAQYRLCVANNVCNESLYVDSPAHNGADYPVVGITWEDARDYCEWAGGQLPTEAQWEYAARGPEAPIYPWGDTFDNSLVNFCDRDCPSDWAFAGYDDGYARAAPVGSFPGSASWIGALNMAGNVWEWVDDWYDSTYYARAPRENPSGPESGDRKVLRGGGWLDHWLDMRTAHRNSVDLYIRLEDIGFRCAFSAVE